jgi:hypothetical protein
VAVFFCGLVRVERVPRYFPAAWLYIMILTGTVAVLPVAVFFCGLVLTENEIKCLMLKEQALLVSPC